MSQQQRLPSTPSKSPHPKPTNDTPMKQYVHLDTDEIEQSDMWKRWLVDRILLGTLTPSILSATMVMCAISSSQVLSGIVETMVEMRLSSAEVGKYAAEISEMIQNAKDENFYGFDTIEDSFCFAGLHYPCVKVPKTTDYSYSPSRIAYVSRLRDLGIFESIVIMGLSATFGKLYYSSIPECCIDCIKCGGSYLDFYYNKSGDDDCGETYSPIGTLQNICYHCFKMHMKVDIESHLSSGLHTPSLPSPIDSLSSPCHSSEDIPADYPSSPPVIQVSLSSNMRRRKRSIEAELSNNMPTLEKTTRSVPTTTATTTAKRKKVNKNERNLTCHICRNKKTPEKMLGCANFNNADNKCKLSYCKDCLRRNNLNRELDMANIVPWVCLKCRGKCNVCKSVGCGTKRHRVGFTVTHTQV